MTVEYRMVREVQMHRRLCAALVMCLLSSVGCSFGSGSEPKTPDGGVETGAREMARSPAAAVSVTTSADQRPRVVFLGDSLTAGLGLAPDQAYPTLVQRRLDDGGLNYHVINAGVSGDTSAGGLSRLDWALEGDVRIMVVALGGNDALRGLPAEELRKNLSTIIERAQAKKVRVVLAGMEAPPNFGQSYIVSFHEVYPDLARKYGVPLIPFLLQGVAGIEGLNQRDGIHPTAEGARIVADNVWTVLRPMLKAT